MDCSEELSCLEAAWVLLIWELTSPWVCSWCARLSYAHCQFICGVSWHRVCDEIMMLLTWRSHVSTSSMVCLCGLKVWTESDHGVMCCCYLFDTWNQGICSYAQPCENMSWESNLSNQSDLLCGWTCCEKLYDWSSSKTCHACLTQLCSCVRRCSFSWFCQSSCHSEHSPCPRLGHDCNLCFGSSCLCSVCQRHSNWIAAGLIWEDCLDSCT